MAFNYISVTAGINESEVSSLIQEFYQAGIYPGAMHKPLIGFLVSNKTLYGDGTRNRRFPAFRELTGLLNLASLSVKTAVHYNTSNYDNISSEICDMMSGIAAIDVLQINTTRWLDEIEIRKIKEQFSDVNVSIQLSENCMKGMTAADIAKRISLYHGIEYVLIDPSRGRGKELDIIRSCNIYRESKKRNPEIHIAFAGGISGANVASIIAGLFEHLETIDFSIDAEGKLRDKHSNDFFGDDDLNLSKVREYLQCAGRAFQKYL